VSAPRTLDAFHRLTYVFTITNNGPDTATGVMLTTKLSSGGARLISVSLAHCVHGDHLVCPVGTIRDGKSVTVTLVLAARGAAVYQETASVSGDQSDPKPKNNDLTAKTTVVRSH